MFTLCQNLGHAKSGQYLQCISKISTKLIKKLADKKPRSTKINNKGKSHMLLP